MTRPPMTLPLALSTLAAALVSIVAAPAAADEIRVAPWDLPQGLSGTAAVSAGSEVLLFGGQTSGAFVRDILHIDAMGGVSESSASFSQPRRNTCAVWLDGAAYLFGGELPSSWSPPYSRAMSRYNPATRDLEPLGLLPTRFAAASCVSVGSSIYLLGGRNQDGFLDEISVFDTVSEDAERLDVRLPDPLAHASAFAHGSEIFILGGLTPDGPTTEIVRFDTATREVTVLDASLPEGRFATGLVFDPRSRDACPSGCAYVFGGAYYTDGAIVEFDPERGTVRARAVLPVLRLYAAAVWMGDHALIIGGQVPGPLQTPEVLRYDPLNRAPTASFTADVDGATVRVDASGSSDLDGSIAGYAWDWGDGSDGSGPAASHVYAASGTFSVALTVVDDEAGSHTTETMVAVVVPASPMEEPEGGDVDVDPIEPPPATTDDPSLDADDESHDSGHEGEGEERETAAGDGPSPPASGGWQTHAMAILVGVVAALVILQVRGRRREP